MLMKRRDKSMVEETVLVLAQERSKPPGELGTGSISARVTERTGGLRMGHRNGDVKRDTRGNGVAKAVENLDEVILGVFQVNESMD